MEGVHYDANRLSVRTIADRYEKSVLNLEPVFQRQAVWRTRQRVHLLDSIFHGYPIPAIFLYRRINDETGQTVFEVIDGKQRLESLLMFMTLMRGKFAAPYNYRDGSVPNTSTGIAFVS